VRLNERELWYLIAKSSAPTIWEEAQRVVAMADRTGNPEIDKLIEDFLQTPQGEWTTDTDPIDALRDPERAHGVCQMVTEQFVQFAKQRGFTAYVTDTDVDEMGYKPTGQGGEIGFDENDEMQYGFYPEHTIATIVLPGTGYGREFYIDFTATQYGYTDHPKVTSATVEDSEPANNFGFLKEPHDELYPGAWIGLRMRDEARKAILDHINNALTENGYPDAGRFINYSVYGSGASYNWDEDGDFDMQMWVDTDTYNEGRDEPVTEDDLVADIRRVVQLVNFPSFKELGLANEKTEGSMLIQYYAKPGKGTKEENLASKPYACFDLEKETWYQKPEPFTPEFYGEWFLLLEPKARDMATQASAVLESLERNIVEWSFWSQMAERHNDERFKEKADQARADAEMDKEGAHNMFLNIYRGRQEAYSPEGEGNLDERDLLEKLLEVWGIFQRLRHATKEPLPWEEQELPVEEPDKEQDESDDQSKSERKSHWHIVAAKPERVSEAVHDILSNDGGTYNLDLSPVSYNSGYYSSVAGYEQQVSIDDFGESTLNAYLDAVEGHPDYLLGAWVDDGLVYLDLTKHIPDRSTAIEFGVYNKQQAIWDIAMNKAINLDQLPDDFSPSPAFAKVAAWKDLMEKAKRIKDQGRVHILNNQPDHVVGRVEGDHGTYTTQIWRQDPNSRAITMWDCECPWDQYAWQRTRQWKKYEGRPCSHTLALFWSAQQQAPVAPEQMTIPGTTPPMQAPPPAPYTPGAPNLEGQGLPRPGEEPVLPRGPWESPQQPLTPPVTPPGGPQAPPAVPVPQGQQIDPRVLRTAPGQPVDPRVAPPAAPGGNSQPQQPGEGGTFGFPGALSHVTERWRFRFSAFENGTIVRAEIPLVGVDRDGRQWRIPRNSKGEVLISNEDQTIAIFPLSTGYNEPHLVKVHGDTTSFSQSHGSPFIGT
jgi:SWIM zinc finger